MKRANLSRIGIAYLVASLLTSCALLSRPEPFTSLRLVLPNSHPSIAWPDQILLERVDTTAVLATNRIVVMDGAKVMQFEGLRWAQEPSVMRTEHLLQWQAQNLTPRVPSTAHLLSIVVTDFSIHLNENRQQTVVVSASAQLKSRRSGDTVDKSRRSGDTVDKSRQSGTENKCASSAIILALKPSNQVRDLPNTDAQTIASTFSDAVAASAQALISQAQFAAAQCTEIRQP
jgi:ABC-type uncharacterized transport system auxiliary subunit